MRRVRLVLQPGIGIKRWVVLALIGMLMLLIGIAFAISVSPTATLLKVGRIVTLANVLPTIWRGAIFTAAGSFLSIFALFRLYKTFVFGASYTTRENGVIEKLSMHRVRRGGPRVVAIGGGTGLASLLRGLKLYTEEITAVVTVADDGGSSGRLRDELGVAPPGDARQCLIALSESEPLMEEVLSYRFTSGEGLQGHSVGNLLLAALTDTQGSFHDAIQATGRLLAIKGQVMPASLSSLILLAKTVSGRVLSGESAIGKANERLVELWIESSDCEVNPAAANAILAADAVVIGPGSLYTSIIPNFLVPGLADAVEKSNASIIFVCNVATQHGETDGMDASDHLEAFQKHSSTKVSHVLVNDLNLPIEPGSNQEPIIARHPRGFNGHFIHADLVDQLRPTRHEPRKLAEAILGCIRDNKGASSNLIQRLKLFTRG